MVRWHLTICWLIPPSSRFCHTVSSLLLLLCIVSGTMEELSEPISRETVTSPFGVENLIIALNLWFSLWEWMEDSSRQINPYVCKPPTMKDHFTLFHIHVLWCVVWGVGMKSLFRWAGQALGSFRSNLCLNQKGRWMFTGSHEFLYVVRICTCTHISATRDHISGLWLPSSQSR